MARIGKYKVLFFMGNFMNKYFLKTNIIAKSITMIVVISFLSLSAGIYANTVAAIDSNQLPIIHFKVDDKEHQMLMLRAIGFNPDKPLELKFYFDAINKNMIEDNELNRLIKYFLGFLTIPEDKLWVNLSPYESDRIISSSLVKLDIGKDLLTQDYILKLFTSSLTNPDNIIGKRIWQKIGKTIFLLGKTRQLPEALVNKIWIVPDTIKVYEYSNSITDQINKKVLPFNLAFIKNARLKVMLEEDYLSTCSWAGKISQRNLGLKKSKNILRNKVKTIFRQELIPIIEKEVNEGSNFAVLRQMYYALILAIYFKNKMGNTGFYRSYIDKEKTQTMENKVNDIRGAVYGAYVRNFFGSSYKTIKKQYCQVLKKDISVVYSCGGGNFTKIKDSINPEKISLQEIKQICKLEGGGLEVDISLKREAKSEKDTNRLCRDNKTQDAVKLTGMQKIKEQILANKSTYDLEDYKVNRRNNSLQDYVNNQKDKLKKYEGLQEIDSWKIYVIKDKIENFGDFFLGGVDEARKIIYLVDDFVYLINQFFEEARVPLLAQYIKQIKNKKNADFNNLLISVRQEAISEDEYVMLGTQIKNQGPTDIIDASLEIKKNPTTKECLGYVFAKGISCRSQESRFLLNSFLNISDVLKKILNHYDDSRVKSFTATILTQMMMAIRSAGYYPKEEDITRTFIDKVINLINNREENIRHNSGENLLEIVKNIISNNLYASYKENIKAGILALELSLQSSLDTDDFYAHVLNVKSLVKLILSIKEIDSDLYNNHKKFIAESLLFLKRIIIDSIDSWLVQFCINDLNDLFIDIIERGLFQEYRADIEWSLMFSQGLFRAKEKSVRAITAEKIAKILVASKKYDEGFYIKYRNKVEQAIVVLASLAKDDKYVDRLNSLEENTKLIMSLKPLDFRLYEKYKKKIEDSVEMVERLSVSKVFDIDFSSIETLIKILVNMRDFDKNLWELHADKISKYIDILSESILKIDDSAGMYQDNQRVKIISEIQILLIDIGLFEEYKDRIKKNIKKSLEILARCGSKYYVRDGLESLMKLIIKVRDIDSWLAIEDYSKFEIMIDHELKEELLETKNASALYSGIQVVGNIFSSVLTSFCFLERDKYLMLLWNDKEYPYNKQIIDRYLDMASPEEFVEKLSQQANLFVKKYSHFEDEYAVFQAYIGLGLNSSEMSFKEFYWLVIKIQGFWPKDKEIYWQEILDLKRNMPDRMRHTLFEVLENWQKIWGRDNLMVMLRVVKRSIKNLDEFSKEHILTVFSDIISRANSCLSSKKDNFNLDEAEGLRLKIKDHIVAAINRGSIDRREELLKDILEELKDVSKKDTNNDDYSLIGYKSNSYLNKGGVDLSIIKNNLLVFNAQDNLTISKGRDKYINLRGEFIGFSFKIDKKVWIHNFILA